MVRPSFTPSAPHSSLGIREPGGFKSFLGYASTNLTDICPAPSYFSQYFRCQVKRAEEAGQDIGSAIRTLYIDRDPITFRDISLHLQGYHVQPRDATHFVRLFADAQFYHRETHLPRPPYHSSTATPYTHSLPHNHVSL